MRRFFVSFLFFFALTFPAFSSYAHDFNVTTTQDRASGACPGDCSLREAIIAANGFSEDNTIVLGEGLYHLTITGSDDTGQKGDLDILNAGHTLTISGASADKTMIDANGLGDRIFDLCPVSGSGCKLVLDKLTLQNGNAGSDVGGAIAVSRAGAGNNSLRITNSHLLSNQAASGGAVWIQNGSNFNELVIVSSDLSLNKTSADGGAIFAINSIGISIDSNCTISQNTAGGNGGGIHADAGSKINTTNSTISQNSSGGDGGGIWAKSGADITAFGETISQNTSQGDGGGIWGDSANPTITNSTISNNTSGGNGGGIRFQFSIMKLINSTVSGNKAAIGGGFNLGNVTFDIRSSTITANTASNKGGGVFIDPGITIDSMNSILSGNSDPAGADCIFSGSGSISSTLAFGIFGNVSSCFNPPVAGNKINITNPGLGPLANNGGLTLTHAVLTGSPALDNGDPTGCKDVDNVTVLSQDQRGQNRKLGANCDSGSVEAGSTDLQITGSASPEPVDVGANLTYSFTVKNGGPDGSFNVNLNDTLPAGVTFVSSNPSAGSCNQNAGTVTCDFGKLDPNASATLTLVATPTAAGMITNTASLGGSEIDPTPGNNSLPLNSTVKAAGGAGGGGGGCSLTSRERQDPTLVLVWTGASLVFCMILRRRKI